MKRNKFNISIYIDGNFINSNNCIWHSEYYYTNGYRIRCINNREFGIQLIRYKIK